MVTMLFKTNIFGIVGSENNPDYKQNIVLIWDDNNKKILCKMTLKEKVLNLKLRKDRIIIVCNSKIHICHYSTSDFQLVGSLETGPNPLGLIGINYTQEKGIIVYPSNDEDRKKGQITVNHFIQGNNIYINAHDHNLSYIALSYNGLLLATSSEEGKKIRIFETETGEYLQELNRGKEKADIKCISIDFKNQFIAASSERGTIHIWSLFKSIEKIKKSGKIILNEEDNNNKVSNVGSMFSIIPNFLGGSLFKNEWSFAQIRLEEPYSIFHFGTENVLIIITSTGKYYKARIDLQKGGECQILEEEQLL
jgi:WD40 repeat protein